MMLLRIPFYSTRNMATRLDLYFHPSMALCWTTKKVPRRDFVSAAACCCKVLCSGRSKFELRDNQTLSAQDIPDRVLLTRWTAQYGSRSWRTLPIPRERLGTISTPSLCPSILQLDLRG